MAIPGGSDARAAVRRCSPRADQRGQTGTGIVWVDVDGQPLSEGYFGDYSPAALALENRWEIDADKVVWAACQALALPGLRCDYHNALSWLADRAETPRAWVEVALWADIQLILGNPVKALVPPHMEHDPGGALAGAR